MKAWVMRGAKSPKTRTGAVFQENILNDAPPKTPHPVAARDGPPPGDPTCTASADSQQKHHDYSGFKLRPVPQKRSKLAQRQDSAVEE